MFYCVDLFSIIRSMQMVRWHTVMFLLLQTNMINTFNCAYKWFQTHPLTININKTHYTIFKTKNKPTKDINIVCKECPIAASSNIKFLGIYLDNLMNWNCHIEYIVPRLSSACYMMRSIKPY